MFSARESATSPALSVRDVVLTHGRYVWRLLYCLGVAERDREDVFQEVFTTVYRKLDTLTDDGLKPWLRRVCVNHVRNYRNQARQHRELLVDDVPELLVEASQEDGLELADAQRLLVGLLDQLDEDRRVVFVLHAIEELPMEQVATIVGCPLSTAYFRFQRARTELEEKLVTK